MGASYPVRRAHGGIDKRGLALARWAGHAHKGGRAYEERMGRNTDEER